VILRREAPHLKLRTSLCGAQRSPATKTRREHEECCASRVWWVIIKIVPVEAVVYQDTKLIHPFCRARSMAHIASPHSPDRDFHRWIGFTDSEVSLVLLLCSQITFDPSSIKTTHTTPTEKSTPSVVPRHSPVHDTHGHCRCSSRFISFHSISFAARPLRPHGKSHWVVPAPELTPASSKHRTRLAYPHIRYTPRERVSQGPLAMGQTAALQWVCGCVVLPICVHRPRWWYTHSFPLLVNTSRPSSSLD